MQIGKKRKKTTVPKVVPERQPERIVIPEQPIEVPNWPVPVTAPVELPARIG